MIKNCNLSNEEKEEKSLKKLKYLTKLYNLLEKNIGEYNSFPKLMNFLLINEFKQNDNNIKKWILKTIFSNVKIMKKTHFDDILNFKTDDIKSNFDKLDIKDPIFECLNSEENKVFEQILLNYFENNIISCFENILKNNKDKNIKEGKELISDNKDFFKGFQRSVDIYSEIYENEDNYRVKKLYSIAYIKIYLKLFVKLIMENDLEMNIIHINEVINEINNIKYKNIIRIYIYKLFLYISADEKEFFDFDYEKYKITFFKDFKLKDEKIEINYCYFLPQDNLKDKYMEVLQLFDQFSEKDYTDEKKKKLFNKEIKDIPFEIITNIVINRIIINMGINDGYSDKKNDNALNFWKEIILSKIKKCKLSKLMTMYLDKKKYEENQLKTKLDQEGFLISLYGLRYCIKSLKNEAEHKNFYTAVLHKKKEQVPFDKDQIPGINPIKNKRFIINGFLTKKIEILKIKYYDIFSDKYENVLDLRYLLLNFILASYLFFAECQNKKLELLPTDKSYINTMKFDFKKIQNSLKEENINSVEIFMHLIFERVSDLIVKSNNFLNKTPQEKKDLENKIDEIIIDTIDNYDEYKVKYIKENYSLIKNKEEHKDYLLVKELIPTEELNEDMKLFILTKTINEEKKNYFEKYILKIGFEKCQEKYPLIFQVLFNKEDVENLKYLDDINNFINYLIKKFSHKITRKEANEKAINNIEFNINEKLRNKFLESWNNLSKQKIKELSELSENSPFINFLIDKKDPENQIIRIYNYFIKVQNNFLLPIINHNQNKEGILHFYIDTLQKEINIQNLRNNQIDLSEINLKQIIIKNSKRNIFSKNDEDIDYTHYNSFIYDLDSIEKELGEIILPGIRRFKENSFKYFTFWGEDNAEILTKFAKRYKQIKIDENDKQNLMNYVKKNYLEKSMKELYESFFVLFFYLNEEKIEIDLNNNLIELKKLIPDNLYLSEDFNIFIEEKGKEFSSNKIIEIFLYLEHLYYELLQNNINIEDFKKDINDIEIIKDKLEKLECKEEFVRMLRRYITRNLIGNKNLSVDLKEDLLNNIYQADLWGIEQMKNFDEITKILNTELKDINITIRQSITLYESIGEKDKETVKELVQEVKEEEDELDNSNEVENLLE